MKRTFLLLCLLGLMGTMVPAQNTILQKGYKKALFIGAGGMTTSLAPAGR